MKQLRGNALFSLALSVVLGSTAGADVVAVVSATSRVPALSKAQVIDIFLGKVSRFPDGTLAMPIDQAEGSPARDEFYATFAGKSPAQIRSYWSKIIFTGRGQPPKAVSNEINLKKLIAADPTAIGYIDRSALDGSVRALILP